MMRLTLAAVASAILCFASSASAATYQISFGTLFAPSIPPGSAAYIPDTFGDNVHADISYRSVEGWGNVPTLDADGVLAWNGFWGSSHVNGAAWTLAKGAHGEIRIEATNPMDYVFVDQFVLGNWTDASNTGSWHVFDLSWNQIGYGSGLYVNPSGTWINNYYGVPGVPPPDQGEISYPPAARGGLILQWGDDAEETAIGYIRYFVMTVPVPLPGTVWLMLSALGGLALARLRVAQ